MKIKRLDLDVSCFPSILPQFFNPPADATFGMATGRRLYYRPQSDFLFCPYPHLKIIPTLLRDNIPPEKIILTFYIWDGVLERFQSYDTYKRFLTAAKELGVDKCIQMDFSVWWRDPFPVQFHNMYFNFLRLRQAQDLGFQTILNFNNFFFQFFDLYADILPRECYSVMVDDNHRASEGDLIPQESRIMKKLLDTFDIRHVFFQSSCKFITHRATMIALIRMSGAQVHILPTGIHITNKLIQRNSQVKIQPIHLLPALLER